MGMCSDRWKSAKNQFQKITGVKKPKPKGFVDKALNHSGLTGALKSADKMLPFFEPGGVKDQKKWPKILQKADKEGASLRKVANAYIKQLEVAAKDEKADKNEKTKYYKGLKMLKAELDTITKVYDQKIDATRISLDKQLSGIQKASKMVDKALTATCANGSAAVKAVKADPTPATFNRIFAVSDNPARKIQVQLVQAATAQKKGLLPSDLIVDPRYVADKFTPWQAGGKNQAQADDNWDAKQVMARTQEFNGLLKLAARFLVALRNGY